jgi:hypothetical protein
MLAHVGLFFEPNSSKAENIKVVPTHLRDSKTVGRGGRDVMGTRLGTMLHYDTNPPRYALENQYWR